jgi:hypothetical protein
VLLSSDIDLAVSIRVANSVRYDLSSLRTGWRATFTSVHKTDPLSERVHQKAFYPTRQENRLSALTSNVWLGMPSPPILHPGGGEGVMIYYIARLPPLTPPRRKGKDKKEH